MVTLEIVSYQQDKEIYIQGNDALESCYDAAAGIKEQTLTWGDWFVWSGRLAPSQHPAASSVPKHRLIPLVPLPERKEDNDVHFDPLEVPEYPEHSEDEPVSVHTEPVPEPVEDQDGSDGVDTGDPYAQLTVRVRSSLHQDRRS